MGSNDLDFVQIDDVGGDQRVAQRMANVVIVDVQSSTARTCKCKLCVAFRQVWYVLVLWGTTTGGPPCTGRHAL